MRLDVGEELSLSGQGLLTDGLELEILQDWALVQSDATLKVVLVGITNEGLSNEIEIVSMSTWRDLSHQLERLFGLQ